MSTSNLSRWVASVALATGLGVMTLVPTPARADDDLVRVIVDVADVVLRGSTPYYRHGSYDYDDRLIVSRDRYGRPVYYRQVPRYHQSGRYRPGPPAHAPAHGYRAKHGSYGNARCDRKGRCQVQYYDPRYDRDYRDDRRHAYRDRRWR
ncbi:hypothetical protein [Luteimonas suaedae]|uniref:hypothetical protein n=1 Tax=Luteimonas suaedae TaxID=2605430 RepID=UPI0011EE0054|nr:hypothetical protein [Luteimonas suaedae]